MYLKSKESESKKSVHFQFPSIGAHSYLKCYLIPEYHTSCIKWINSLSHLKQTIIYITSPVQISVTSSSSSSSSTSKIPESCSDLGLVLSISVSKIVYASFLDFLLLPILGCCKTMLSRFLCCWAQNRDIHTH